MVRDARTPAFVKEVSHVSDSQQISQANGHNLPATCRLRRFVWYEPLFDLAVFIVFPGVVDHGSRTAEIVTMAWAIPAPPEHATWRTGW